MKTNRKLITPKSLVVAILLSASTSIVMADCWYLRAGADNGNPQSETPPDCVRITYSPKYPITCAEQYGDLVGMSECVPNQVDVIETEDYFTYDTLAHACAYPMYPHTDTLPPCEQDYIPGDAVECP